MDSSGPARYGRTRLNQRFISARAQPRPSLPYRCLFTREMLALGVTGRGFGRTASGAAAGATVTATARPRQDGPSRLPVRTHAGPRSKLPSTAPGRCSDTESLRLQRAGERNRHRPARLRLNAIIQSVPKLPSCTRGGGTGSPSPDRVQSRFPPDRCGDGCSESIAVMPGRAFLRVCDIISSPVDKRGREASHILSFTD
ncbi:hypothetical protein SKAU_G00110770 [Synaphobranchus kaupii]|uniref:Uncharacterized protein n=1 Tax=Synaphobranchus kaupii TaxID=118154 RepID=A0A9Q1G052_SYNKA|nr:hypothetical protein SKAU_G00110770 [Synaphobranchus kaupii]